MQALLIECVIRSSLIAAFAGLVLFVMRIRTAAARHGVWAGVMLAMLALPALVVWGPKAPLPVLRPAASQPAALLILPGNNRIVTSAEPAQNSMQPLLRDRGSDWAIAFMAIYLAGALVFLIRMGIGIMGVKALLGGTVSCAAPVTVGWLRPKVILPSEWRQWPQAQLDAVLAHEREHARRRDPLWRLVASLNRALFWFHPLAWWLERKLSGLAEEACDAAVLACGYDPRDYSEFLLDLARSVSRAGARVGTLGVSMPGIGLEYRICQMLSGIRVPRISRARMACTVALCTVAAAIFAAGTPVRAQSGAKAHLEFEVASVRPSNPNGGGFKSKDGNGGRGPGIPIAIGHGRFNYSGTLLDLIVRAYHVAGCRPGATKDTCRLISGGPQWIDKDYFDIQAKTPEGTPDYTFFQVTQGQAPEIQRMLQALLNDRFNLKFHRERRQMPVYELVTAQRGPKIKVKKPGPVATTLTPNSLLIEDRGFNFRPLVQPNGERMIQLTVKNWPIEGIADIFSMILDRPVLEQTSLKGEVDFALEYAAEGDQPVSELTGPELFTALQEQAGLRLQATRAAVDVLVIDNAEKPSEN